MLNSIEAQALRPPDRDHAGHLLARRKLLNAWATRNGLVRSGEFTLDAMTRGLRSGGAWGRPYEWPGCDHPEFFKREGRCAAIVTEPYRSDEVKALMAYAAEVGLAFHAPPNPRASTWFPPHTFFAVLTMPSFGEVRWLPDQVSYRGRPL